MQQDSGKWEIKYTGIQEGREDSLPALLAVGNGRIGIRGAVPEYMRERHGGIFAAGFYDQLPRPELYPERFNPFLISWSNMALVKGYKREVCIVNCPDFLDGSWELDGEKIDFSTSNMLSFTRTLSMDRGEFTCFAHFITPMGKEMKLTQKRFAHMEKTNHVYSGYRLESGNFSGRVVYTARINGNTKNFNISGIYQDTTDGTDFEYIRLYDVVKGEPLENNSAAMHVRGRVDGLKGGFATKVLAKDFDTVQKAFCGEDNCFVTTEFDVRPGDMAELERVSVFEVSSFEKEPYAYVKAAVKNKEFSYSSALAGSMEQWASLWEGSDIVIEGDDRAQVGVRHSLYQLLIAACGSSSDVSVPAKGLSGEGYRGMVFWDTDIHMLPFYIHTQPRIARNIVKFRYNTLKGARDKASRYGFKGASFPWETGMSGSEECEDFLKLLTHQVHITADVVYAMQKYVEASGDIDFYLDCASEVYIETARYWISKGYDADGKLAIPDASGPDELHIESGNSAYVNNLAAYNLRLAGDCIRLLKERHAEKWAELAGRIGITDLEVEKINKYKDSVMTMKRPDGLYEQCEGFFGLRDEIVYEESLFDVPADTQTVKQADVLMLLYLLPELVTEDELLENWKYYEPRTTHTSSLSYGVHGIIAAQLGMMDKALFYLDRSMGIDLYNEQGGAVEGAHLAAGGMTWSAVVNGIAGCRPSGDAFTLRPYLPEGWNRLKFSIKWKDSRFAADITAEGIKLTSHPHSAGQLRFNYKGSLFTLAAGESICLY